MRGAAAEGRSGPRNTGSSTAGSCRNRGVPLGVHSVLQALSKELPKGLDGIHKSGPREAAWKADETEGTAGIYYDELTFLLGTLCILGFKVGRDAAPYITGFIPAISNWAVYDIFLRLLKMARADTDRRHGNSSQPIWSQDRSTAATRFGVVMMCPR